MKKTLLILALFVANTSFGKYLQFTPDLKKAHGLIIELRFDEAQGIINAADKENGVKDYLEGVITIVQLFMSEDKQSLEEELGELNKRMDLIEKVSKDDPLRNVLIGKMRMALAILYGKRKSNLRAAWQFYKAYNLLSENYKNHPDYLPTYMPLGVLYTAIGSLPKDYQPIASLLGFKGDVYVGINMLKKAYWRSISNEDLKFYKELYGFIYSYVVFQVTPHREVTPRSLGLNLENGSFQIYLQSYIDFQEGRAKEALELLYSRPKGNQYYPFHYLDYMTGKVALPLQPDSAVYYLQKYLSHNNGDIYIKSTYRYLSWYELLYGSKARSEEYRQSVIKKGNLGNGADKRAYQEALEGFNPVLVKGRLLYDGGMYKETIDFLASNKAQECCRKPNEKSEFYYRLGRAYHKFGNTKLALKNYELTLSVVDAKDSYAIANSSLQAGHIYEDENDRDKAKKYYEKALEYDGFPSYEGIHQKAKSGLSRLKES